MDAMTPQAQMAQALTPQPKPTTHDVTIVTTKKYACAKVLGVPPEEFGIDKNARSISDANYAFHDIVTKTEGGLIAEGFDEDQVRHLATYTGGANLETLARDTVFEHSSASTGVNSAARIVRITEHYIRLDYEGTGKLGLYMIITGGDQGEILRKTVEKDGKEEMEDCVYPIDMIPFAAATPVPMTHRFIGRSIADLIMDIQRIKTALLRGALDNTYLHNAPRPVVSEAHSGPNTIDDILTVRQGAPIRMKQPGGIEWQVIPDITPSIFPMMQYMDATREIRTGMSNQSQGLDANALQNQSATAVAQVFSASQMRMKLIARIIAEGVKDIFSLLHATIRKHGQQAQTVRLRNNWVNVDPRQWKTRNDMTIHVGLGNGDKAQQYVQMMGLANFQKELILGGKGHLVPDAQLFNTASELVRLTGHKNPDKFFADPSALDPQTGQPLHPPQPPPPDPKLIKVQADMQIKQMELQQKGQETAANAQIAQQADERKAQIETVQAHSDMETQKWKAQTEAALQQQKFEQENLQAERQFELDRELKLLEFSLKEKQANADMQMKREQHQMGIQTEAVKVAVTADSHDKEMARGDQQHKAVMQEKAADREAKKETHTDDRAAAREDRTENRKDREAEREAKQAEAKPEKKGKRTVKLIRDKNDKLTGAEIEE